MEQEIQKILRPIRSESQVDSLMAVSAYGSGSELGRGEGNCFFNCMEYVGSKFGLEIESSKYGSNYHDANYWERGGYVDKDMYGPSDYEIDTEGNAHPNALSYEYLQTYFATEKGGWKEDKKDIEEMITHNRKKEERGYVFAVISKGEIPHAVILNGIQGNYFTYKDPTSGENDVKVSYDDVCYATKIYGLKK